MAGEVKITGGAELRRLSRQLRVLGDKELSRELYRGLNRSVKPLTQRVKDYMPRHLPDRYAEELAKTLKVRAYRRMGRDPRIDLIGKAKTKRGKERDLSSLNRGRLRHPLYGNRKHWFDQKVRPDWWTHPMISYAPYARKEIELVMGDVKRKLEKGK